MMASSKGSPPSVREVVESLLAPEIMGPLDELSDVLLVVSAALGRLRRVLTPGGAHSVELTAIDQSFSRSIALTRELRERLQTRRPRGEYTSLSHVAREVVGRLQAALPEALSLALHCPPGPAIVAAERGELRRVVVGLLETGIAAASTGGLLELEVSDTQGPPGERARRVVQLELRCAQVIDEREIKLSTAVRPIVRALGGTMTLREPRRGGTAVSVRLPSAC